MSSYDLTIGDDGRIDCPENGCDGFLDTLAPVPYTHMCVMCNKTFLVQLKDDLPDDEDDDLPPWEDREELEEANERLRQLDVWLGQGVVVLMMVTVSMGVAL